MTLEANYLLCSVTTLGQCYININRVTLAYILLRFCLTLPVLMFLPFPTCFFLDAFFPGACSEV